MCDSHELNPTRAQLEALDNDSVVYIADGDERGSNSKFFLTIERDDGGFTMSHILYAFDGDDLIAEFVVHAEGRNLIYVVDGARDMLDAMKRYGTWTPSR